MMQNAIVFLVVIAAALYVLWRWMPTAWKHSVARRATHQIQSAGLIDSRKASEIASRISLPTACGACAQCKGCHTDAVSTTKQS
jgi:hypothetical protein